MIINFFMAAAGSKEDLIKKYNLQNIDVLKVGHHGSRTISSKIFMKLIKPNDKKNLKKPVMKIT